MEVPSLEFESELQLPAYAPATASQDLSRLCHLHHSSWQHQILNPLTEARDQTHTLMDTSQVRYGCARTETPFLHFLFFFSQAHFNSNTSVRFSFRYI